MIYLKPMRNKKYYLENPWANAYDRAKYRCRPEGELFLKGRTFSMVKQDFKFLWFRDKAHGMKRPSIDRIDNSKGYFLENCRFLELVDNIKRSSYWGLRTRCNKGHEFTPENTKKRKPNGRICKICANEFVYSWRKKIKPKEKASV